MNSGIFSGLGVVSSLATALALAACASPSSGSSGSASLTAADVSSSSPGSREAEPAKATSAGSHENAPPGDLVCRAESRDEGGTALYLTWDGTSAKGVLRRIAPSGMVTDTNVRAQRHKEMIIADDTMATDLVVHAATVGKKDGNQYIRLGDWKQSWAKCM